jgi:hypothetical protein
MPPFLMVIGLQQLGDVTKGGLARVSLGGPRHRPLRLGFGLTRS